MKQQTDIERVATLLNRFNACLDVDEREGTVRSMMTFFAELIRAISGTYVTSGDIYDTAKVLEEREDSEFNKWIANTEPIEDFPCAPTRFEKAEGGAE